MSVYDMSEPDIQALHCSQCGDSGADLLGCDDCGAVICWDCAIHAADDAPFEFCEKCAESPRLTPPLDGPSAEQTKGKQ